MHLSEAITRSRFQMAGFKIPGSKRIIVYDAGSSDLSGRKLYEQTDHKYGSKLKVLNPAKFERLFIVPYDEYLGWFPICPK